MSWPDVCWFDEAGDMDTTAGAADAPDIWSAAWPPGGYVCETCGTPTESEPCREHQPAAWAAMT